MKQNLKTILISLLLIVTVLNLPSAWFSVTKYFPKLGTSVTEIAVTTRLADYPAIQNTNVNNLNAGKMEISTTTLPLLTTLANQTVTGILTTGTWNADAVTVPFGGTGATSFTQYGLLLGSSTNPLHVLTDLGTSGQTLTSSGVGSLPSWTSVSVNETLDFNWTGEHTFATTTTATSTITDLTITGSNKISGLAMASSTTWTASGTYTKSANVVIIFVQSWGAGGSGGKSSGGSDDAGGGGGGVYDERWILASDLGSTETITLGTGGAAKSSVGAGNNGGDTTFGSLLTTEGGNGGGGGADNAGGGSGGTKFVNINGLYGAGGSNAGEDGIYSAAGGGASGASAFIGGDSYYGGAGGGAASNNPSFAVGGTSAFGGDGGDATNSGNAENGVQPGGGGGGHFGASNSGAGADGQVIVTEFF